MTDARQPRLPFDEFELEGKKKPAPPLPFYDKPETDNERLLNLQYEFKHGDQKALAKMYRLSLQVCMKLINKIAQKNKHIRRLSADEKMEKAHDAAAYIIEQYAKRGDFVIKKNMPGYLFLRVEHELFYQRAADKIVDFIAIEDMERLESPETSPWGKEFKLKRSTE